MIHYKIEKFAKLSNKNAIFLILSISSLPSSIFFNGWFKRPINCNRKYFLSQHLKNHSDPALNISKFFKWLSRMLLQCLKGQLHNLYKNLKIELKYNGDFRR